MSVLVKARFKRYIQEFGGYIISDEYYDEELYDGMEIYPWSFFDTDIAIIVAMMEKSSRQVADNIGYGDNILFLSIPNLNDNRKGVLCD